MIKISYKVKDNHINYVEIKGHAGYADSGFDIVCASVSSIALTTINSIIRFNKDSIKVKEEDGYLLIEILDCTSFSDILMENMICMLVELSKQYKKYVKIN